MDEPVITGGTPAPAESSPAPAPQTAPEPSPAPAPAESAPAPEAAPQTSAPAPSDTSEPVNTQARTNAIGGVKLVVDPVSGKRSLVRVAPAQQQQQGVEPPTVPGQQNPAALPPNIRQPPAQDTNPDGNKPGFTNIFGQQDQGPKPYTDNELLMAVQQGSVDESRIPEVYKPQYQAYKQKMFEQALQASVPNQQEQAEAQRQTAIEANNKFYDRVTEMAKDWAMRETGVTQNDLDTAEYSDDAELTQKVQRYEAALQNAQGSILAQTRERVMEQRRAEMAKQNETMSLVQDANAYIENAKKSDPNFQAIDTFAATWYKQMPYEQGQPIAQAISEVRNGQITRENLGVIQHYFEDARKQYYARASGAGTVPTHVSRPPSLESPGVGNSGVVEKADPTQLRKMNYQQKLAWLSKNIRH